MSEETIIGVATSVQPIVNKSLTTKLSEVLAVVEKVPKNGWNDFHKYKYATEADVSDAVRKGLAERHIFIFSEVSTRESKTIQTRNGSQELTSVWVKFTFVDGDSGEERSVNYPGDGADTGDKGIYKAITGAMKYFLLKSFLLSSGDDPEKDSPEIQLPAQRGRPPLTKPTPPQPNQTKPSPIVGQVPKAEIPVAPLKEGEYVATDSDLPASLFTAPEEKSTESEKPLDKDSAKEYIKKVRGYGAAVTGGLPVIKEFIFRETGKKESSQLTKTEWEKVVSKLDSAAGDIELLNKIVTEGA